ncbi:MAG: flagellar protein FlaG [Bacillota bacterium]
MNVTGVGSAAPAARIIQNRVQEPAKPPGVQSPPDGPQRTEEPGGGPSRVRMPLDGGTFLQFSVHEETKDVIVRVLDSVTGEVIREFPPEAILDMVARMLDLAGLLVDEKR